MPIDTSITGFTGFYEPPPAEPPMTSADFLRGILRGVQAQAARAEAKRFNEGLAQANQARLEAGAPLMQPRSVPSLFSSFLSSSIPPDPRQQQLAINQAELAMRQQEAQQRNEIAARRFMAQQAYQSAVARDIAAAEDEAANYGLELDDPARVNIAARNFLQYGPAMGEGFGSSFSTALQMPRREAEMEQRFKLRQEEEVGRNRRADELNKLRQTLATERATRSFAPPEIGRLIKLRDEAIQTGDNEIADIYDKEITIHQAKALTTSKSRIHTELATTLRQQMRAIDSNAKFTQAQKDELKAPLLQQLEQSRREAIKDLEGELPPAPNAEQQATQNALLNIDRQIAEIEVDLKKNPKKGALDFGEDNRKVRLKELKDQRDRLKKNPAVQSATAPVQPVAPPKPPGLSDDDLLKEARDAIKQGRDPVIIKSMLKAWGVKGEL